MKLEVVLFWVSLLSVSAFGGSVFATSSSGDLYEIDTRSRAAVFRTGGLGLGGYTGLAYDPLLDQLWVLTTDYRSGVLFQIDRATWAARYAGSPGVLQESLAFNPISQSLISVGGVGVLSVSPFAPFVTISPAGLGTTNADWFDDGGFVVSTGSSSGWFYAIDPPAAPRVLNPWHVPARVNTSGLAYDKDTKTFWEFTVGGVVVFEPENFQIIAGMNSFNDYDGAAGSVDNVPNQTPALIISSMACPAAGPAYVTVVDATPGGHVQFGSSLQAGNHRIRGGACAGTTLGLNNPTPRYDLVANSYGIASTRVNFTAAACGNLKIQAVDMDTCLATSVQPVDYVMLP